MTENIIRDVNIIKYKNYLKVDQISAGCDHCKALLEDNTIMFG